MNGQKVVFGVEVGFAAIVHDAALGTNVGYDRMANIGGPNA
jgi:hypothetical protein